MSGIVVERGVELKRTAILIALAALLSVSACAGHNDPNTANESEASIATTQHQSDQNDAKDATMTDAKNRTTIARALGVEEDARQLRFILASLDTIEAGIIQEASLTSASNDEEALDVVAENGTNFRIYLTANGSVEAVQNLSTGEWPITSSK